jgi:hypothetical protein
MSRIPFHRGLWVLALALFSWEATHTAEAGILVFAEGGTAKADNASLNKTFADVIVGAANPTTAVYSVVNTTSPVQAGAIAGSLTMTGDATASVPSVSLSSGGTQALVVGLNAGSVGIHSGNVTLHRTTGTQSTGKTTFTVNSTNYTDRDDTIHLQVRVLDHSDASFQQGTEQTALTLDFGTLLIGQESDLQFFEIWNRITTANFTAGLVLTDITASGETDLFSTNIDVFSDPLFADNFLSFNAAFLSPASVGRHTATYVLHFSDQNLPGATTKDLTLTLQGTTIAPSTTVAPEPSSIVLGMCGFLSLTGVGWWRRRQANA